ncbi:ectoine/hydroxyectoine ABC transporter substrate-binding protein EhuB [Bradyrhizobium sp. CCBAU 53421]|uniref:ectoine/hydroxyectoine ABC transporter substrate-binding protein EhuB n=1 Tax=Bradyrhizobium sp. CCBAU 53421 TaxID=1325120 RepID=UPI00188A3DDE|nr:ectoine/hydroxyectoine ABC transporter substrate-binding protein EhuB [Bradyrhizobium sp. CCBAU 53421]QOZ36510.1 ectoine/hydroxyectoine ABC transporter substrate-binding protein EhuB [Bradyrhizobium sp. CCBAU 53421]
MRLLTGFGFRVWGGAVLGMFTATSVHAESAYQQALRTGSARVAVYNQVPWGVTDEKGEYHGFAVDVLRTALERMGIGKFEAVSTEFSALIPALQAHRADAVTAGLFVTPERCRLVAFGDPDIKMTDALLVKTGNPKNLHSYEDVAKNAAATIGTARGFSTAADALAAGVPRDRQTLFPDNQAAISALIAGRVDAVSATAASIAALYDDLKTKGVERAVPFVGKRDAAGQPHFNYAAVAFRQKDADFRDAYNMQLKAMKIDGALLKILQKYGFSEAEMPDATSSSLCGR